MVGATAVVVAAVRYLVMVGTASLCVRCGFSSKTRGKIIGYTTSMPEFVTVISSALVGVFDAGLWNIAASNIINWVLFLSVVIAYRQYTELWSFPFLDEIVFGLLSVAIPLVLFQLNPQLTVGVSLGLLAFFGMYAVCDRAIKQKEERQEDQSPPQKSLARAVSMIIGGIAMVLVAGRFLGQSAHTLILHIAVPSWLVGWIWGFISSVPELASFFLIYKSHQEQGKLHLTADTQEALDALVASNMVNLGIILPLGMMFYTVLG